MDLINQLEAYKDELAEELNTIDNPYGSEQSVKLNNVISAIDNLLEKIELLDNN